MKRSGYVGVSLSALLPASGAVAGGTLGWVEFSEQTATRLVTDDPAVGAIDTQEKDYAWGDVDQDGDTDLVVVRKQPWVTAGGRRNVLFMNEGTPEGHALDGILVDRTSPYIPAFLDLTNDRDAVLADVNGDGWLDIVTAVTLGGLASPKSMTHPRVYINLGDDAGGSWQGFAFDDVDRIPTLPFEPRFNSVAAGDADNDGDLDLYFVDFESGPYARGGDLNDRFLANDGAGYFTDVTAEALTPAMASSGFGVTALFADLNLDGSLDIAKSDDYNTVEVFSNAGDGTFDVIDLVYQTAPLFVSAGDLNDDGRPDLVISDDGIDRYLLNLGNGGDGLANFSIIPFPAVTNGFGEETLIVDLDFDGLNDVIIADVDVDIPGCSRTTHVLHNVGNPSTPSFVVDAGNIPQASRTGCHDVAVIDLDRDGLNDIIFGRCSGTQVWMGVPSLVFGYPSGLPALLPPEESVAFEVTIEVFGQVLDPGSPAIHVSVGGGHYQSAPLAPIAGNSWLATLPPAGCLQQVNFYLSAAPSGGAPVSDPPGAPITTYVAAAAAGTAVLLADSIEGDVSGWIVTSDLTLTSGAWEQADPNPTFNGPTMVAPADDATPGLGALAFITQNGPPGNNNNTAFDVDNGATRLTSPAFDLAGADAMITYQRWLMSVFGVPDSLLVEVSNDGGASWTLVEAAGSTQSAWQAGSFRVGEFVIPTATVRVRFSVSDVPNDSATEAGIDDFQVVKLTCGCPWDLDGDAIVGMADLLALLAAWGDPWGINDLLALLAAWGPC